MCVPTGSDAVRVRRRSQDAKGEQRGGRRGGWHDEQCRAAHDDGERMVRSVRHDAPEDGAEGEPSGERQGEELVLSPISLPR